MAKHDDGLEALREVERELDVMRKKHEGLERNTIALANVVADLMGVTLVLIRNEGKDPSGEAQKAWDRAEKMRELVGTH